MGIMGNIPNLLLDIAFPLGEQTVFSKILPLCLSVCGSSKRAHYWPNILGRITPSAQRSAIPTEVYCGIIHASLIHTSLRVQSRALQGSKVCFSSSLRKLICKRPLAVREIKDEFSILHRKNYLCGKRFNTFLRRIMFNLEVAFQCNLQHLKIVLLIKAWRVNSFQRKVWT